MREEYDFSNGRPNPYAGHVKKQRVTMNVNASAVDYFKAEGERTGVPYQTIINMFLTQCAAEGKRLTFA